MRFTAKTITHRNRNPYLSNASSIVIGGNQSFIEDDPHYQASVAASITYDQVNDWDRLGECLQINRQDVLHSTKDLKADKSLTIGVDGNYIRSDGRDNLHIKNENEGDIIFTLDSGNRVVINGDLEVKGSILGLVSDYFYLEDVIHRTL